MRHNLTFCFHNPNTQEQTITALSKLFIQVSRHKMEEILLREPSSKHTIEPSEGVR